MFKAKDVFIILSDSETNSKCNVFVYKNQYTCYPNKETMVKGDIEEIGDMYKITAKKRTFDFIRRKTYFDLDHDVYYEKKYETDKNWKLCFVPDFPFFLLYKQERKFLYEGWYLRIEAGEDFIINIPKKQINNEVFINTLILIKGVNTDV